MKLTGFRDKVVLLHFWGTEALGSISSVRRIARRYKDGPFVVLGINGDGDRKRVIDVMEYVQEKVRKGVRNLKSVRFENRPFIFFCFNCR